MNSEGYIFLDFSDFVLYLFKVVFPTTKSAAILCSILLSFPKAINEFHIDISSVYILVKQLLREMATNSSTIVWRIPWTEELDKLQSVGSQRVRHGLATEQPRPCL